MSSNAVLAEHGAREHSAAVAPVKTEPEHSAYPTPSFGNHSQPAPERPGVNGTTSPGSAAQPLPHGYSHPQASRNEIHIHPELRSGHEPPLTVPTYPAVPNMIPSAGPSVGQDVAMSGTSQAVAPAMSSAAADSADGRKAKRELSQSKRAAQNRAAQRAFRQRKEGYIKKLEQQVRDYGEMEGTFKALQSDNYLLRQYVVALQSRLLETHGEYPPPPPGLDLAQHHHHQHNPQAAAAQPPPPPATTSRAGPSAAAATTATPAAAPPLPSASPNVNSLEVAAQAVAGLTRSEQHHQQQHLPSREVYAPPGTAVRDNSDDARTAEEITRQLQADGAAEGAAAAGGLPAAPM